MKPPEYPQKGKPVEQTVREIIDFCKAIQIRSFVGGKVKESTAGTTLTIPKNIRPKIQKKTINPFYPTLSGDDANGYFLIIALGYVVLRKKGSGDAVTNIIPTSLPYIAPLSVAVGDKITCLIEENGSGEFTTTSIVKTSGAWPTSTAPKLKGGSDSSGTSGARHIRLCEVIKVTDEVEVMPWHTGHIDHFAPELIDNIGSGSAAGVLKDYSAGMWNLRRILAGDGITVTENANDIEVKQTGGAGVDYELTFTAGASDDLVLTFTDGRLTDAQFGAVPSAVGLIGVDTVTG
jgi:hypothetical protein